MSKMTKDTIRNRIVAITNGFRTKLSTDKDEGNAKAIADLLHLSWPGNTNIHKLFSEITGYDLVKYMNGKASGLVKYAKPLVCIVPIHNSSSSHGHVLNKPIVISHVNVNQVNCYGGIHYMLPGEYRLATEEELNKLTDTQFEQVLMDYTG